MTCIVGLVEQDKVIMGADSAGSDGWILLEYGSPKLFRNGEFLIGFTSSWRMGQLLRYSLRPPVMAPDADIEEYMVTEFVEAVRTCFKDGGWARKDEEQESGGCFLVGVRGRLFFVDDDYQVGTLAEGFAAVGSGQMAALGSLFTSQGQPASIRVEQALRAAERFTATVRSPFRIEVL
jgi:ATP-dependent protease HslVU (ClpYQ) peptidase subunit